MNKVEDKRKIVTVFTPSVCKKIKELYPNNSNKYISDKLGINLNSLNSYAFKNDLKKAKNYKVFRENGALTREQKEFIIKNYANMKSSKIINILGITQQQLNSYAVFSNIKKEDDVSFNRANRFEEMIEKKELSLKNHYDVFSFLGKDIEPKILKDNLFKSKYGKYTVSRDYFENIDNEWKAYWLGFLYADGCVSTKDNIVRIRLQKGDKHHLQKFLNSLQSDSLIRDSVAKLNGKEFEQSEAYICNSKIVEDLINCKCVPNKSLILEFPSDKIVPNELKRHFIRGYFDGDGWFTCNLDKKNIEFGFIGTPNTMNGILQNFIEEIDVNTVGFKKNHGKSTTVSVCWGGVFDCQKIYKYLYSDCNIYLERKLKKIDKVLCLN